MSLIASPSYLRESPEKYSSSRIPEPVYEISMGTLASIDLLKDPQNAHRLVQALLQGRLMGEYELLDFMIWPEGFFTRIALTGSTPLSRSLKFLRERSLPAGMSSEDFWESELRWIRLVPPEKLSDSTRFFLEKADLVRREISRSYGFSPNLFFFYRNSALSR